MASQIKPDDIKGRKPGIRRLVWRELPGAAKDARGARPTPGWGATRDQLRRTVRRAPEVVIIVEGGGRADASGKRSSVRDIAGVHTYMKYISRDGQLPAADEKGEQVDGRAAIADTHAAWNLDLQRQAGWVTNSKKGRAGQTEQLHQTFDVIFSMPVGTDPQRLFAAVQAFAHDHFPERQYLMVLHTPETDPAPKSKRADHPHVHAIIRAEDDHGQRLYIRKGTLRAWREAFAAQLRDHGVEANATSRAARGVSLKAARGPEWHIQQRYEENQRAGKPAEPPKARTARFEQAAQELQAGRTEPKPWELAMAVRRRDVLREYAASAARLRAEGDAELAAEVERFAAALPPLDTERHQMQRAIADQVRERTQAPDQDKDA